MKEAAKEIQNQFSAEIQQVKTSSDLEAIKIKFLGKKGLLQSLMGKLRDVAPEDKPQAGKWINELKVAIEQALLSKECELIEAAEKEQIKSEKIDVSLPARRRTPASKHPVYAKLDEIVDIFVSMGFSVFTSPEIETDYYNFEALNFPADHPARDMQDTFYIEPNVLLRTHTSPAQIRVLQTMKPPIRIVCPGRCYRNETVSSRSHVFFHQVEGFYVAESVSFQDFFATISEFLKKLFQKEVKVRVRPSYFPFVEPGVEVDCTCFLCEGKGCSVCKRSGWLEVMGAGMIHPHVLANCGHDPEVYSGFAFGMGIERLTMVQEGVSDIRTFFENDMRFLRQFPS